MRKTNKTKLGMSLMLFFALINIYQLNVRKSSNILLSQDVNFSSCIDGDTAKFNIHNEIITVRFLSIDTPETVKPNVPVEPNGKEASDYTCNVLSNAKEIRLEYENNNKRDKYDRVLAWIIVDNELLQLKLVHEGLAKIRYERPFYKYLQILKEEQVEAQKQKKGIWLND